MIRLILVEDYSIIRAGLRMLLNQYNDLKIVAEASDGLSAVKATQVHVPDVVLMDIELPELGGLEATTKIVQEFPDMRILILSNYVNEEFVLQSIRAGAKGYVKKDAHVTEIRKAIDTVMSDQTYFAADVSRHMVEFITRSAVAPPKLEPVEPQGEPVSDKLTPRQIEILTLIAQGMSTKEISQQMCISHKTVEAHRANIMKRLDIFHVAGLTRYAMQQGLTAA